jgi:hypothetical protein
VNVVVSTDVLARLALAPANHSVHNALMSAGMEPDLVARILDGDDTPQVGDWRAERCLVLTEAEERAAGHKWCDVSHETGVDNYPTDYLRGLPLIDVGCDDDVATHMAAML